jgi:periplasmic protein TonB
MNTMNTKTTAVGPMLPASGAALLLSIVLFGLMYSVIKAGHGSFAKREILPTIDFVRLKRDSDLETLTRSKPPPPPPAPPPPPKMKIASDAVAQPGLSGLSIPNLNLKAEVSGGALAGSKGAGAGSLFDGDIVPLQCPPTTYPSDARRAGLTGWVQVEFVVNPDGSVRSARAIDAQPKGLFEAAAVMAAQRCRFKPKTENGLPVEQRGRRKWNFDLNKGAV